MPKAAKLLQTAIEHHKASRFEDAEAAYREVLEAPLEPQAERLRLLGSLCLQTGQGALAAEYLERASKLLPEDPETLTNYGTALRLIGKTQEAVLCYRSALQLCPSFADAAFNLASTLHSLDHLDEARICCKEALRFRPDFVHAHILLGLCLQEKGKHREAIQCFSQALKFNPASNDAAWNKSLSLLALGEYEEGWRLFETGLQGARTLHGPLREPRWKKGESLRAKRLLIQSEGGYGDTLQFIRYAEVCKKAGATVIVSCPSALHRLFSASGYIDELCCEEGNVPFDYSIPLMSFPQLFGTTLVSIPSSKPYLCPPDDIRIAWAKRLRNIHGLKVGLAWAGSPRKDDPNAHRIDHRRSIDLDILRPLFETPNTVFVSLQLGEKKYQIIDCGLENKIIDVTSHIHDFADTAALIDQLDLVISVDTAVAHLAGGMGKPVWILSRFDACWRWLQNRPECPWYPSARIFGQESPGHWTPVVDEIRKALRNLAER
jgi:tetratricopeptide (TPR) repeat protein